MKKALYALLCVSVLSLGLLLLAARTGREEISSGDIALKSVSLKYDLTTPDPNRMILCEAYLQNMSERPIRQVVNLRARVNPGIFSEEFVKAVYKMHAKQGWEVDLAELTDSFARSLGSWMQIQKEGGDTLPVEKRETGVPTLVGDRPLFTVPIHVQLQPGEGGYFRAYVSLPQGMTKYELELLAP